MHSLLKRQLRKRGIDPMAIPGELQILLEMINTAYHEFDEDRRLLERSLELSSTELLEANSKMRAVLRAFPDLFLRLDANGSILEVEGGGGKAFSSSTKELKGRRIQDIPDEGSRQVLIEALREISQTRRPVTAEYSLVKGKATEYFEVRLLPLIGDKFLAVIRTITDRKLAEAEALRMEQEQMKATKLESLGLMSGGIAHNFNNILAAIMSNISLVRSICNEDANVDEILGDAELACHRAKDLSKQLMTFSKGGTPIKTSTSINDLTRDITVFALRGSNVNPVFEFESELRQVDIDVGQIGQVINNIVINADQSMPSGGTLTIRARNLSRGKLEGFPLSNRDYIKISISDQGLGIRKKDLDHIFDPYFSTKQKGSGLGLATSYSIVKRHDGVLEVESIEGSGTVMHIYLPVAVRPISRSTVPPPVLTKGEGKVLIMDDEGTILNATGRLLTYLGFQPSCAYNGTEAISMCRQGQENDDPFVLVIMDLIIPGGMGGQEAAGILHHQYPEMKIIASSGYSDDPVLANYGDYGFIDILPKPYNLTELNDVLMRILS